ncbi:organic hydroperoxide reductase OsmC/OhrA [Leeuwenhoekiella aestuarii]|uniref:Organic hydroperoxide reductase OsmC/OhrA n=1 Tax=Leeuwenhoekiella aestuarii TaxID=2249426 RepID=A0A4Q0NV43_9FLAO|nr:OsmC family protein [Leeuwenhoekiella aestuarii]RXG11663.1 organic hydroperoxide reductase OsmC/OhrA [Leeuwenhoekiella aestuarii]RXG15126.1 organic hydroperoxide reductase OsmC/OhrA [Leeuwenhoekiella aestuarii]
MIMVHHYNVDLTWQSHRKGLLSCPELMNEMGVAIEVATPVEFFKGMPGIWSPEHLFVESVSGCLMTTFLAIAENSTLEFTGFSCNAKGRLEQVDGVWMMSEILLKPTVFIQNEGLRNKAIRIVKKAEHACLISHSIKSKISMEIAIKVDPILIDS